MRGYPYFEVSETEISLPKSTEKNYWFTHIYISIYIWIPHFSRFSQNFLLSSSKFQCKISSSWHWNFPISGLAWIAFSWMELNPTIQRDLHKLLADSAFVISLSASEDLEASLFISNPFTQLTALLKEKNDCSSQHTGIHIQSPFLKQLSMV